jgi:VanZ family protein
MAMEKGARFSNATIGWGIYLIVSASYVLQLNTWLTGKLGKPFVMGFFWSISIFISIMAIAYALKARLGALKTSSAILVFVLGCLLSTRQQYFSEKAHILLYGLLGCLAARDMIGAESAPKTGSMVLALSFVALIGVADELFQWVLPYRFCETKDIITNILSGALGIGLFIALRKNNR